VDEHMMLLPPAGYLRRYSAYAATDCVVAMLSATDMKELREDHPRLNEHMRPFIT
jgi:hypothetical protein